MDSTSAWSAARSAAVMRVQRDEYLDKYTNAEIFLGLVNEELKRALARIEELEKQVKPAASTVPDAPLPTPPLVE